LAPRGSTWLLSFGPLLRSDHDLAGSPTGRRTPTRCVIGLPETEGQALARYRSPGGEQSSPNPAETSEEAQKPRVPSSAWRGRVVVAAVAAGAFAAAGQSLAAGEGHAAPDHDDFNPRDAGATFSSAAAETDKTNPESQAATPEVLPVAKVTDASEEAEKLAKSARIAEERAAALAEAMRPKFVTPAEGYLTSGCGRRWGTIHYGIDIANSKGTPIYSVADGVVIEAGPASGFGLWVRVQHEDGSISVYGHVNTILVNEGETVKAGDQIATM